MFGRRVTARQRERARDYIVHHAARYGWLPPTDDQEALLVLSTRLWELLWPTDDCDPRDRAASVVAGLETFSRSKLNRIAEKVLTPFGAVTGFLGYSHGLANGEERDEEAELERSDPNGTAYVLFVMKDPWQTERWIQEMHEDLSALFVVAWMTDAQTIGDVMSTVDGSAAA